MKEIEIYKKMLRESSVEFSEGVVSVKKPKSYFREWLESDGCLLTPEEIEQARENAEKARLEVFG